MQSQIDVFINLSTDVMYSKMSCINVALIVCDYWKEMWRKKKASSVICALHSNQKRCTNSWRINDSWMWITKAMPDCSFDKRYIRATIIYSMHIVTRIQYEIMLKLVIVRARLDYILRKMSQFNGVLYKLAYLYIYIFVGWHYLCSIF